MGDGIINPELFSVQSGNTELEVEVDLNDARLGGARDYFLPGRYLFEITKAAWMTKADQKAGRNFMFVFRAVGPEGCSELGKSSTRYVPAPCGTEKAVETGKSMMADLTAAIMSMADKLDPALEAGGKLSVAPSWFKGKRFAAAMKDGAPYMPKNSTKMIPTSDIDRYLTKDEYEARNGVDPRPATAPAGQQQATPAQGAATGGTRDLMKDAETPATGAATGGNAAPAGKSAMDALVDF